jgi:PKD repeat protein
MKHSAIVVAILLGGSVAFAQSSQKCSSYEHLKETLDKNPGMQVQWNEMESRLQEIANNNQEYKQPSVQSVPRVIPVVFHVIHEGGAENISKAQILDQIRILNLDYSKMNADTVNTPAPFASVSANCNIEFRLAQKDPNGNCTDGIVRVYSPLTNNADDNTKSVSDWPSTKYLNVWVVKSIAGSGPGVILGYAQFPGMGNPNTDGVLIRHDCIGSIGTAQIGPFPFEMGRTATHEVGHWLGLRHIWGDANCGNDFVNDTPKAQTSNSGCPSFPHNAFVCSGTGANGEMFCNYMDYSNGNCLNMFTAGQKAVMDFVLNGTRANIHSSANLIATGTDGSPAVTCAPICDLSPLVPQFICAGASVNFASTSYNGQPTSWSWSFPGGTPSTSTDSMPVIQYNTAGTYNVTLTVSNSAGSDTKTVNGLVLVSTATANYNLWYYFEGFETMSSIPSTDFYVVNNGGNAWTQVTGPNEAGVKSVQLLNDASEDGQVDELIGPSINMSLIPSPILTFWVAYAQRTSSDLDKLQFYVSTNCGQTWNLRYSKSGTTLSTVAPTTSSFVPANALGEWRQETVNLGSFATSSNLRYKFVFTSNGGNNVYIDNINISGANGIEESGSAYGLSIFPDPVEDGATLAFGLRDKQQVSIRLTDVVGRTVRNVFSGELNAGGQQFSLERSSLQSGIYFVVIEAGGRAITQKIVIN